ncbi:MAG: A/G-specific adenine glycosylase [Acutalibacter sp.]|jgi:A/G-specific adenine glycosylase
MEDREVLAQLPERLLAWYDAGARVLPWREDPTPYRVWVSEIMLQQTRVEAVKPYYERFLSALPTVEALAQAPEEQLLKLWEGLGYYNRVRNLQKGAQAVMERYGGQIPASFEELRTLPGIGDYTAGAIASIAFQIPVPAVDGNVLRVISRVLCRYDNILDPKVKRRMEEELRQILPRRVGDFNQSLMELGAMVCQPNGPPKCLVCPLHPLCRAYAQGVAEELPVKAKAKPRKRQDRTVFLLFSQEGRLALHRRPEKGLLAGLWELPGVEETLSQEEAQAWLAEQGGAGKPVPGPKAKHIFSHVEWHMTSWVVKNVQELPGFAWASEEDLREAYPLPAAFKAFLPEIHRMLAAHRQL